MKKKVGVPAPLWKRIIAYIIDILLIYFIILTPFMGKFKNENPSTLTEIFASINMSLSGDVLLITFIITLLTLFYWGYLEYKFGQSVGKIIMRLGVISTIKNQPLTFMQAIIRNVTKLSTLLIVLDTLYMIFKKSNQRYFEIISKTTVIEVPR
ncbi:MAG: RDD family protein [Nanoarchaeota archaeon]|nr:RDD family protein [Nanoarchaeota archaeon]